ncbi:MAG TPA: helix-turn-helix domain-containing protein, partial [Clostridiales bacterium]|nr:helix-turn-helix domain-containing protein [Clostridiales bacterium]
MDYTLIGKQIAKGRKNKGLSQSALATMLNVTPQAVSKWERNESLP